MISIQRRLTVGLLAVTTALSVAAGTWLYCYVRAALLKEFDAGLAAKAHALAALLHVDRYGTVDLDYEGELMPEYERGANAEYFMIIQPKGTVVDRSPSLQGKNLLDPNGATAAPTAWDLPLPDARPGRALAISAMPDFDDEDKDWHVGFKPPTVLVVTARPRTDVDRVMSAIGSALAIAAGVLAIGGALAVRYVVRRGLRPVNQLAETTSAIGPETLDYRFETALLPLELQPICRRINDLLERLEQAFRRERRLNADVAHELRTPIAELRTLTDVARRWPCDAEKTAEYFHDAGEIARRMEKLVETLLALARGQSGKAQHRIETVNLGETIQQVVQSHKNGSSRNLHWTIDVADDEFVSTDRLTFARIIENLLSNAFDYAAAGGRVCCTARSAKGRCELTVANSNDSLTQADLGRMFDAFWRKDAARSGDAHAGLGLALVAEYARELGIAIAASLPSPDWFEITMVIPAEARPVLQGTAE